MELCIVLGEALQDLCTGEVYEILHLLLIGQNHQLLVVPEVGPDLSGVEVLEQLLQDDQLGILNLDAALLLLHHPGLQHHPEDRRPGRQNIPVDLDFLSLALDDKVAVVARLQEIPEILFQLGSSY